MNEKLLLVALGWLLGIISPVIVDAIRRRRENALGRTAILSELRELAYKLALAAYGVRMEHGTVDHAFLQWLKPLLEQYAGFYDAQAFVPRLRTLIAMNEQELAQMNKHTAQAGSKGLMLQRYPVPLLDSRVAALWSFDTEFQRQLLEIRTRLELLDDLVDRSRKYFDLTFTKLEGNNYALVTENFSQACAQYAQSAENIVGVIMALPRR